MPRDGVTAGMQGAQRVSVATFFHPWAALSLGAAAIHYAVTAEHFAEWWAFGIFFAAISWFQALWAIGYALRPTNALAGLAIVVNATIVVMWIWSRTLGVPLGPGAGTVEEVGLRDALATLLELTLVFGLIATHVFRRSSGARREARAGGDIGSLIVVVLVVAATTLVLAVA